MKQYWDKQYIFNQSLLLVLGIVISDIVIYFDIPIVRPVMGFFFLAFVPGLVLLRVFRLTLTDIWEKIILVVGLSLSFVLLIGLLINNLFYWVGILEPLSTGKILVVFNALYFIGLYFGGSGKQLKLSVRSQLADISTFGKVFLIIAVLLPGLSVAGTYLINQSNNNILLLILLVVIPAYVMFVCIFNRYFPPILYPIVIFLISISLLLIPAGRSAHIIGADTNIEYYYFISTLSRYHWGLYGHTILDSALSISLLPTIYQSVLKVSPEMLFKYLYSLLFSGSPVVIYFITKKYVGQFYGFLGAFSYMAIPNFLLTPLYARINVAMLFFELTIAVNYVLDIPPTKKRLLSLLFIGSAILSHYATSYLFFLVLLCAMLITFILSKVLRTKFGLDILNPFLFLGLIYIWYSDATQVTFDAGIRFMQTTFLYMNQLFVKSMVGQDAQEVMGRGILSRGIPEKIEFVLVWIIFILVFIAIATVVIRYKGASFSTLGSKKLWFLKEKMPEGYYVISLICFLLIVAVTIIPWISIGYSIDRTYFFAMVPLSMFLIIGGLVFSKYLKIRPDALLLLVLVPYYLANTGVLFQFFGEPQMITINSRGVMYNDMYIHDQESQGAKWLSLHMDGHTSIYTIQYSTKRELVSQGDLSEDVINNVSADQLSKQRNGYVYLGYRYATFGHLPPVLDNAEETYDNGGAALYNMR